MSKKELLLLVSTTLVWGTVWIGITFQIGEIPLSVSIFYRILIAAIVLFLFSIFLGNKLKLSFFEHQLTFLMGSFLFSINYYFFYLAIQRLDSGLVAVIFSSIVLFNVINEKLFFNKKMEMATIIGGIIGIIGTVLLFNKDLDQINFSNDKLYGIFYSLIATTLVSLGNILSSFLNTRRVSVLSSTTIGMFYGAIVMLIIIFVTGDQISITKNYSYWISLFYLAIICTALAFILYLNLIKISGPSKASFATILFPILALILSSIFETYKWNIISIIGIFLLFIGLFYSFYGNKILKVIKNE